MTRFSLRWEEESLSFLAAHAIHFYCGGEQITEPLHWHQFRVKLEIAGPLKDWLLIDFLAVRAILLPLLASLDGKKILPCNLGEETGEQEIGDESDDSIFILDNATNATAEAIGDYLLRMVQELLLFNELLIAPVAEYQFRLELEEAPGNWVCATA